MQSDGTRAALHETTSAPVTGIGKQLAGSADVGDFFWDCTKWDCTSAEAPADLAMQPAPKALLLELERSSRLAALRARFRDLCRGSSIATPPMHAIERWRFLSKWHEDAAVAASSGAEDALFPTGPATAADRAFAADLTRSGASKSTADAIVRAAREASAQAAAAVAAAAAEYDARPVAAPTVSRDAADASGAVRLRLRRPAARADSSLPTSSRDSGESSESGESDDEASEGGGDSALEECVEVNEECLLKLGHMHRRACPAESQEGAAKAEAEAPFLARAFTLLLRHVGGRF